MPGAGREQGRYASGAMGQTRVDLQHLLEDLRDAYPDAIEETILSEVVANALDSGASSVHVLNDPSERTLVVVDDGCGMSRRELSRYHDLAASTKTRGEGIGFAGVGIKLGLLVAEAVLTETRRGSVHVATRWHLASRHKAPWQWVPPPGWVGARGTAVGLKLRNPLSPLLDAGYVESRLRLHYEPLFDPAFDAILAERYPSGVRFSVNGRAVARRRDGGWAESADLVVRFPRKKKPAAVGYLARTLSPLPEDRQGLAVSTLGKVIRRGWDWIGLSSSSPGLVGGLVEAPGLSVALTLNKGDFVRAGRRGITYLAYRKVLQEAVQAQLAAWGEARDREDSARRRAARPLERDLEAVLRDLADDFPALAALVEQRPGGQKRLPTGREIVSDRAGEGVPMGGPAPAPAESEPAPHEAASEAEGEGRPASPDARDEPAPAPSLPPVTLPAPTTVPGGARRPTRYGLSIDFEHRPDSPGLGRLVESTVLVNTAHPACLRAVASRSEGYHAALAVGMALAEVAVEPAGAQAFLTTFLARWGEAVGRDRRRRQPRARE
jgi:Histidine kinase-, DNA gyrase B-, and HSP90-like ATPase